MANTKEVVRVAAVGDIHVSRSASPRLQTLFSQVAERADILVLCGDLCDYGLPEEAHLLAKEISNLKIPIVGVLGNHDFESGQTEEVSKILCEAGIQILDGDAVEIKGIGFAGVKGFGGGFGRGALGPWGEEVIKLFVREAVNESLKLESALARLRTEQKIAVLHYSPVQATVEREPVEIFPFLGSSRLEEPLLRYPVNYILHGHAHRGTPEGKTINGTPVYNVAMPLMIETFPDQPPFRLLEIPVTKSSPTEPAVMAASR